MSLRPSLNSPISLSSLITLHPRLLQRSDMGEAEEVQLRIIGQEPKEVNTPDQTNVIIQSTIPPRRSFLWWLRVAIYTLFVFAGQSVATILGRLYYDKGGNSKWMASLVQPTGFPVLIPLYLLPSKILNTGPSPTSTTGAPASLVVVASVYFSLGLLLAAISMLNSVGLLCLPVSTYALICASQLGFTALFSSFLNAQKFTPYIINSLVLLTISSILLVFHNGSTESTQVCRGKYAIGFICTVSASAGTGLILCLVQLTFLKVLKQGTFRVILDLNIFTALDSACAILVGFFASGDWKGVREEMDNFELGKVSYLMILIWIAICWQVFSIGCTGLILEVSPLFCNAIGTFSLPAAPVLAVFIFHDKMNGIKVIGMVLAIWGFVSYFYQQCLDNGKSKSENGGDDANEEVSKASLLNGY